MEYTPVLKYKTRVLGRWLKTTISGRYTYMGLIRTDADKEKIWTRNNNKRLEDVHLKKRNDKETMNIKTKGMNKVKNENEIKSNQINQIK